MGQQFSTFFVRVNPRFYRGDKVGDLRERCEQIKEQITRHVDEVLDMDIVESDPVCEFCGDRWTEDNPRYNGGCCPRDSAQSTVEDRLAAHGSEGDKV